METESRETTPNIPSLDDFAQRYPHYGPLARDDGRYLFDLVMSPSSYHSARNATLEEGRPAVAGVARICCEAIDQRPELTDRRDYMKQYTGALVCALMEANGFGRTGQKRAVPNSCFTVGEFYELSGEGD